jgi:hypothetical protein
MQITINFATLKKIGVALLVVMNLVGFVGAIQYNLWRHRADPVFQIMEFDLSSRQAEIQQRFEELKRQAVTQAEAAKPTSTTTLPAKETPAK